MRHDVVYRRPCCGVTVTVGGTPNGDEAYAEAEATKLLYSMCRCSAAPDKVEKREVPANWSYAPPTGQAVVGHKS